MWEEYYGQKLLDVDRNSSVGIVDIDEKSIFLRQTQSRYRALVAPALSEYVASQLREESQVLKERRKAREEKGLLADTPQQTQQQPDRTSQWPKAKPTAKAKDKATGIKCMSNMKQIGLALVLYEQDTEEVPRCWPPFEPKYKDDYGVMQLNMWYRIIQPYLGKKAKDMGKGVFICPSSVKGEAYGDWRDDYTYAMNKNFQGENRTFNMSQIQSPSETIFTADIDGYNAALYPDENDNGTPISGGNVLYRHGGGTETSSFYVQKKDFNKSPSESLLNSVPFGTANSNYFDGHSDIIKQRAPDRLFRLQKRR